MNFDIARWAGYFFGVMLMITARTPVPVDLVELTAGEWEEGQSIPKKFQALDGVEISASGYMHTVKAGRRRTILLIADTNCRCAGSPPPNKFIEVHLDKPTDYIPGIISVYGTFDVGEELDDGFVTSLYRLEARMVE